MIDAVERTVDAKLRGTIDERIAWAEAERQAQIGTAEAAWAEAEAAEQEAAEQEFVAQEKQRIFAWTREQLGADFDSKLAENWAAVLYPALAHRFGEGHRAAAAALSYGAALSRERTSAEVVTDRYRARNFVFDAMRDENARAAILREPEPEHQNGVRPDGTPLDARTLARARSQKFVARAQQAQGRWA